MTDKFIIKAKNVHGDKYDYSLANYVNYGTKIKIICSKHGEFEQTPQNHLKGNGCFQCGRDGLRLSNDEFIKKATEKHRDLYDYSLVDYKNAQIKVKIICKKHGEFEQRASGHLSGDGCKKCVDESMVMTNDEFIKRSKNIYGDLYDYSLVNYKNAQTKVKIICKKHGELEKIPSVYLYGSGCKKCTNENMSKTLEQFLRDAVKKHGDAYDYSLVNYINSKTKVKIVCKKHGEFQQNPSGHVNGKGCSFCCNKTEGKIKQLLIENNILYETQYNVDNKRFDFLIDNKYILECDGSQHFPHHKKQNTKFKTDLVENLNTDIMKMKSIIHKYPIVRLLQENIWNDSYEWKDLILNLKDLQLNILYIRLDECDMYKNHLSGFVVQYLP